MEVFNINYVTVTEVAGTQWSIYSRQEALLLQRGRAMFRVCQQLASIV